MKGALPLLAVLVVAGGATMAFCYRLPATPVAPAAPSASQSPAARLAEPPVAPATGEVVVAPVTATAADRLDLPDGTSVALLNGTTGALTLASFWGARAWSPIVRIERTDAGVDWYVHADGTRSTTEMRWRSDLGRNDAMVRIAVPVADPPPIKAAR
ncbi:MAG: hypothetical protein U1E73_10425 [Planctomycetota bacterium]